jgi:hypothetical protein
MRYDKKYVHFVAFIGFPNLLGRLCRGDRRDKPGTKDRKQWQPTEFFHGVRALGVRPLVPVL